MKKYRLVSCLIIIVCIFSAHHDPAFADNGKLDRLIKECTIVFKESVEIPEGIPQKLLKKATGIVIFPSTVKGAFFLGGRYGEWVVLYRNHETGQWGPPAFFTVSGLSFGWQIGGQAIDLIFVIPTERGFESMLDNKINVGTNSALVLGPVGRNAELGADIALKGGIFTYSRSKGLFAGIGLKGLAIDSNSKANDSYYTPGISTRDILMYGKVKPSEGAQRLITTISKHTK